MWHALRYVVYAIIGLIVLVGLVVVSLATPPGRALLASVVEDVVSGDGLVLSIDSLTGWPPFSFGADRIVLSDAKGPAIEVDGLSIDLDVGALFAFSLGFDEIAADRVAVAHIPATGPAAGGSDAANEGGGGGMIPLSVDQLDIARVELGPDLIGQPAALAVAGTFAIRADGGLDARLNAERIDGGTGVVAASVVRADGSAPFALDVMVEEGADGILIGLMGRETGPGYQLAAETSLAGNSLDGSVNLISTGAARFAGQVSLSDSPDGQRLVVSGNGDLAELVPADFNQLLAGRIDVEIDVAWSQQPGAILPRLVIRNGAVSTDSLRISAEGTFGGPGSDLSLRIDAADPDGQALVLPVGGDAPLRIDSLSLNGRVAPTAGARRLDLVGRVAGLGLDGIAVPGIGLSLAVEAAGDDPSAVETLPFALRVEADSIDTTAGRIVATETEPLLVSADGTLDIRTMAATLEADLSAIGGNARFTGTASAETVNGEAETRFADLAPLSPLVGQTLAGALSAVVTGTFYSADGIALTIAGTATDLDPGQAMVASMLAGQTRFSLDFAQMDSRLSVDNVDVVGAGLTLAGNMALDGETIDGDVGGSIADLSEIAPDSAGAASFSADISGSLDRPTFDVTVRVAEGELAGQPIADAMVRLDGGPVDTGWQAALNLAGSFAGRPLEGTAQAMLDTAAGRFALPEVDLSIAENRVTGAIEQTPDGLFSGSLTVDAPNIATLAALALVEATGSVDANVRLDAEDGRQSIVADFTGQKIAMDTIVADKATGDIQVEDAFGDIRVAGKVDIDGVSAGSFRIDTAHMTASVDGPTTSFDMDVRGPDIDLTGTGSLTGGEGGQTLRVARLSGKAFGFPLELEGPATAQLGDTVRVDSLALALGGGRITANGQVSPRLDLNAEVRDVNASFINQFSPGLGAEGTINATVRATGTPDAPAARWQARVAGFAIAETRSVGLPGLAIEASGDAGAESTTVDAALTGAGMSLRATGRMSYSGEPDMTVTGSAPLELAGLFVDRELRLGGTANLDVRVAGLSSISGVVTLNDATFVDVDTAAGVAGVGGQIRLSGNTASLDLRGRMAQGGSITIGGTVTIDPAAGLPANISVNVADGRYIDGVMIDATFSADLRVTGPVLTGGTASGRVRIANAEVLLPDQFGTGAALPVEHINVAPGYVAPVEPAPRGTVGAPPEPGGIALDIDVATTGRSSIIVRGFGLDAELGGSLQITGTTNNMVTIGAFEMARGRIEVLGRRFDFTTGKMTFTGDLVPVLDFDATTRTTDLTVNVEVTGPADDPEISFTSTPELPEEEVIAQLLFGQSVGSLSAFQAAQLVDAIGQLSGVFARGDGIFTRVRKATGLDDIDIRENESGGTTVGVGKRINDNIRLGVEQDTKGAGRVTIDLDLTRNLKARGEAGSDGSGKIGLNYEYEY